MAYESRGGEESGQRGIRPLSRGKEIIVETPKEARSGNHNPEKEEPDG
jgi:hypothetical protein